jgi:hypothetical protein
VTGSAWRTTPAGLGHGHRNGLFLSQTGRAQESAKQRSTEHPHRRSPLNGRVPKAHGTQVPAPRAPLPDPARPQRATMPHAMPIPFTRQTRTHRSLPTGARKVPKQRRLFSHLVVGSKGLKPRGRRVYLSICPSAARRHGSRTAAVVGPQRGAASPLAAYPPGGRGEVRPQDLGRADREPDEPFHAIWGPLAPRITRRSPLSGRFLPTSKWEKNPKSFLVDILAGGDDHEVAPTRVRREKVAGGDRRPLSLWPDAVRRTS